MSISPFIAAINQIVDEKGISRERVIETIEAAVAAAYRREYGKPSQIIRVKLDEKTGEFKPIQVFEIVETEEELEEPARQKTVEQAKEIDKNVKAGEEVSEPLEVHQDFGRIAAQTAKQVIIQRLREAERDVIFNEFKGKENQLLTGNVQQIEGDNIIVSLGKANAVLPAREQIPNEHYRIGQRLRVYLKEVSQTNRGPQIILSRSDERLIHELFAIEVPEIPAEDVEIKSIAREAGSRTKIAVTSHQENLDPVGSCVGQKGTRVQAVLNEISDEKIDIILWNENIESFIKNALSPAKVNRVKIISTGEQNNNARVYVDNDQLSLAIGKNGQNVRLASKLTKYTIDVEEDHGDASAEEPKGEPAEESTDGATTTVKKEKSGKTTKKLKKSTKPKRRAKSEDESDSLEL